MTDVPRPPEPEGFEATGPDEATPAPARAADHDATGLDLARAVARSLAGLRRRRPQRTPRPSSPTYSGAHPDDRDPQTLDATLGRLIEEQGWSTDVRMHGVFARWETLVGRDVAQHCRPESFTPAAEGPAEAAAAAAGGRLVVRTDSTAWATQMRLLAPTVVRRINEELGHGTLAVVEVLGPHGPTWKKGLRSVRDGRGPRDTYG